MKKKLKNNLYRKKNKIPLQKMIHWSSINEPNTVNMVITLSNTVKRNIEQSIGMPYEDLILLDADQQIKKIEEKTGKKLRFAPIRDGRLLLMVRGSIYIMMNRFFHFNHKLMDKKLNSIIKRNEKFFS